MNPQRILGVVVTLIVVALLITGCASETSRAAEDDRLHSSPLAVIAGSAGTDIMSACASSAWPENCEVQTIRIQRAVGLFYIEPGTDVDNEMQRMNADFAEDGALYESLVSQ